MIREDKNILPMFSLLNMPEVQTFVTESLSMFIFNVIQKEKNIAIAGLVLITLIFPLK